MPRLSSRAVGLAFRPAVSFGIMPKRGNQGVLLPRASTRYASFGSQKYSIDFNTLLMAQLYAALVPADRR
jgi:hypothetical protein